MSKATSSNRWLASWLPIASVCLVATLAQVALGSRYVPATVENRPIQRPDNGYAGSSQCMTCHPSQYASWHASYHRTMTQIATPATVAGRVDGTPFVVGDSEYRLELQDGAYFARKGKVGATDRSADTRKQVVLLTGSHHQQVLWLESGAGRAVEPFPYSWLIAEKRWVPMGDTFLAPPDLGEGRGEAWNVTCLNCHATNGRPRMEPGGRFDSQVAEFGIACEACHGEGAAHIAANQNPVRRYALHLSEKTDPMVANPARMKASAAALACGQCHSVWDFDRSHDLRLWNEKGGAFRPGQENLGEKTIVKSLPAEGASSFWPDGMIRVTGREYNGVQASPCFAGGEFSCLSCHEMHPERTDKATLAGWVASQVRKTDSVNQSCVQCHPKIGAEVPQHTRHAAASSGSECYNCHMPFSAYGLLGSVRSHQVSSPTAQESQNAGRPNACVLCHLDKPLAWSAEKLNEWYGTPMPSLSIEDRTISAAVQWILKGDAGQRALVAWSMGWAPAQKASGTNWLPPYLAITLNDPYSAVRFIAAKSLRTLPGFERFEFDYVASEDVTAKSGNEAYQLFLNRMQPGTEFPPASILNRSGEFQPATFNRLLDQRDHRRVYLVE